MRILLIEEDELDEFDEPDFIIYNSAFHLSSTVEPHVPIITI